METTIGARVAQAIPGTLTQAALAQKIEMTPDALSRSIHGKRAFATVELARIADVLKVDLYYLVTGEPDPHRLVPSARHAYDPETRQRSVGGLTEDREICEGIHLAYRQAYPQAAGRAELPSTVEDWRERLGVGFPRDFLQRLVDAGVDVVRVRGLSTSYSFWSAGRPVIAVGTSGNWFYQNWSLAHELGHLALGHQGVLPGDPATAGPLSSPHPDTTAMSRVPEPDFAAAQPGLQDEDTVRDTREPVAAEPAEPAAEQPVLRDVSEDTVAREQAERETVVARETVAGPGAAEDDISAPAVVDGQEVETNEQAEKKGKKKRGFLSRFFDL